MKKRMLLYINLFLSTLILAGFLTVLATNYATHRTMMEEAIENISKLTSSTIYARINDELTKPLYVSQTMANDTFLKTWLKGEGADREGPGYLAAIEHYLLALKEKYGYDTAYAISAYTNTYYYFDGINKVVGQNSRHDQWYYDFIGSGARYVLNIDEDEVNQGALTVFIDSRIEDETGALMGVTGVGVKLSEVQALLRAFEEEYQLEACLIRADGSISVHTDDARINQVNLFEERAGDGLADRILASRDELQITWLSQQNLRSCVISRYIENLDWYLVVEKDTGDLYRSFQSMFLQNLLVAAVVLVVLLTLSTLGVRTYQRVLYDRARVDELTGLHDRQYFLEQFPRRRRLWLRQGASFFLLDVDRFKAVNDTCGHLMGNTVLSAIGGLLREEAAQGVVIRWGGDEFAGILPLPRAEILACLERVRARLAQTEFGMGVEVTLSIGITCMRPGDAPQDLLERADQALYTSKNQGRDCISWSEE